MHSVLCIVVVPTLLFRSRVVREAKAHRCSCSPTLGCVKLGLQSSTGAVRMHSVLCIGSVINTAVQKQSCEGSNKLIGVAAVTQKAVANVTCRAALVQSACTVFCALLL